MKAGKFTRIAGLLFLVLQGLDVTADERPNIIMFVVDDLNDWVGPLGNKQAVTPNLDRLAKSGVTFSNAHAPGVFCAPSRTAIWTGLYASTTGCYQEEIFRYDHPELVAMQTAFKQGGYATFGAGKLYHHRGGYVDLRDWDEFYSRNQEMRDTGWEMNGYYYEDVPRPDPYPYSPYYIEYGNKKSPAAGHLEWGPIPNDKEEEMVDTVRTEWLCDVLKRKHDKPFFAAVGLYTPHYPNYVPQKYLDLYNRDKIEPPPYKEDDLDDLPPAIKKRYTNRSIQQTRLVENGWLKDALLHYYGAITYADAMLGRVLDTLGKTPYRNNTIIVFWSDQGFHHGEKGEWDKHSLWRQTTKVPFIWAGAGIAKGERVETAVSLIDLYPTFAELCGLPAKKDLEGESLATILKDPAKAETRDVFVPHMHRGGYAVVNSDWRYIQYNDGTEELYNLKKDPNEWENLAGQVEYKQVKERMQKSAPSEFAPSATPRNKLKLIVENDSFRWEKK